MSKAHQPDLKKYLDKKLKLKLNGNREVIGTLRGFDAFMNIVINDAFEVTKDGQQARIDMAVIRGNSVNIVEAMDRV
ncbi:Small nuclear ribonucleoprotein G [Fasciolopsis buskii]|uniref:Sm protein G n=1 Tax=Fasciolopsis buskii TaxID=27845 RepID=A0A8E0VEH7_9TREM|nr:Small nuclear ribonucleoprotein G [Fasciolopsis buski]